MQCKLLASVTFLSTLTLCSSAQVRPGGGGGGRSVTTPTVAPMPGTAMPSLNTPSRTLFLTGKVVVDDGTPLTDPAMIQSNCRGRTRTEGYTDSKGSFSLEFDGGRNSVASGIDQAEDSASANPRNNRLRELKDCELQAKLPGFTSQVVELSGRITDLGNSNVGSIVLHRVSQVEGFTISATTASAPPKAKKEYDKGREQAKKQKWDGALENFQKAVELYPRFAVAWFEMGQVQLQKNDIPGAQHSFRQSLDADSKFINPYQSLAQISFRQAQWQDVIDVTSELLKLNPVSFPQSWMFNAAANYYLQRYDAAELSAHRGLEVDTGHRVPKLEHLFGLLLAQKHDYVGAVEHIKSYLRFAPNAADAETVRRQLQEFEQLSTKASR
jgi:tetratricopeptide (TPR) repeat protein